MTLIWQPKGVPRGSLSGYTVSTTCHGRSNDNIAASIDSTSGAACMPRDSYLVAPFILRHFSLLGSATTGFFKTLWQY
jgi:hypothetical protein